MFSPKSPPLESPPAKPPLDPRPRSLMVDMGKSYGGFHFKAAFTLAEPGITVVFGPSGAGKTTLLNLLAGLSQPDWGFIRYQERTFFDAAKKLFVPPEKRRLSCVFQESRLFSHFSVRNNLLFPARFGGRPLEPGSFDRVVELLGLEGLLDRRTITLSGGEAQRVAIGRALLAKGQLLLMDEPLSSLDRERKTELLGYIAAIPQRFGTPTLYVTHAEDELERLADRVLTIEGGQCHLLSRHEFFNSQLPLAG